MLGLGTVGGGVARILHANAEGVAAKAGGPLQLGRIAVRDLERSREVSVDGSLLTDKAEEVVADPDIDVVVEVMGGVHPALALVTAALQRGKPVVTANKELIARHGPELLDLAARHGAGLYYEASVAGGIPIVRPLKACLAANRIRAISGIINGTTNYMLTRMSSEGDDFEEVLREAQRLGYAEADPSSDVDGHDAAFKIAILASLAFDAAVDAEAVHREGIGSVTPEDLRYGREFGYVLKLLAVAREQGERLDVRVHPTFIPEHHPLAAVNDVFNAVFVTGDAVGDLMFYGRGAGGLPTGSAVTADIIEAARLVRGSGAASAGAPRRRPELVGIDETVSRYYVSLGVVDKPGVLGRVAAAFGDVGVGLDRVVQKGGGAGGKGTAVRLVVVTHRAPYARVREALDRIGSFDVVHDVGNVIRVQEGEQ